MGQSVNSLEKQGLKRVLYQQGNIRDCPTYPILIYWFEIYHVQQMLAFKFLSLT